MPRKHKINAILRIDFKPNDIAEVTFTNQNGSFEMVYVSMEVFREVINIKKLKRFIENKL